MPRMFRAIEAGKIMRLAGMVEHMDDRLMQMDKGDMALFSELVSEKAKWQAKNG